LAHPLGQQCEATAKGTGRRCERRAIAANVCYIHGGRARQVKQKAEQRLAVYDAQVAAQAEPTVIERREPEELILDALHDTNAVLQQLKAELHGGSVNPILLQLAGEWLDRLGRLGKVITDGDLATKLHERLGWLAKDRADVCFAMLESIVEASPLTAAQRLAVWEARYDGLKRIADGQHPFQFSDGERRRFTDRLQVEAARESALAEGLSWGPDSESDSDVLAEDLPLDGALL
jgi:hypothetical protein